MAITLSRCNRETEDNLRDAIQNLGATACPIPAFWPGFDHAFT
jgi:hypothetical protein